MSLPSEASSTVQNEVGAAQAEAAAASGTTLGVMGAAVALFAFVVQQKMLETPWLAIFAGSSVLSILLLGMAVVPRGKARPSARRYLPYNFRTGKYAYDNEAFFQYKASEKLAVEKIIRTKYTYIHAGFVLEGLSLLTLGIGALMT